MVSNNWFRKHQKKIFVALGVIIMVTWYMASAIERLLSPRGEAGGEIFGERVSAAELIRVKRGLFALAPEFYAGRDEKRLTADAWQHLIELAEAEQLGAVVSEEEIREIIRSMFRSTQGFDAARYEQLLARTQLQPAAFEQILRERLQIGKMQEMTVRSVKLSDEESWQWYRYLNEGVKVRYAELPVATLTDLVEAGEDALKTFHEQRMGTFAKEARFGHGYRIPEKVRIEYLLAPVENFRDDVVVTERQVEKYYDDHKFLYLLPATKTSSEAEEDASGANDTEESGPKYRRLAEVRTEIVKKVRAAATQELSAALMERVNEEIGKRMETVFGSREKKSVDFRELGKEFTVQYGITDFFDADHLPEELSGAVALSKEAFGGGMDGLRLPRGPIDTPLGRMMFQVIDLQQQRASAYEEVSERVEQDFRLEKARDLAVSLLREASSEEKDFEAAVVRIETEIRSRKRQQPQGAGSDAPEKRNGKDKPAHEFVRVGETGFLTRPKPVEDGPATPAASSSDGTDLLASEAFRLEKGRLGVAAAKDALDPNYLFTVTERKQTTRREFEEKGAAQSGPTAYLRARIVMRALAQDLRRRADPSDNVTELLEWRDKADREAES